jgi:inosine-uridine nucleoside N-ribohydrolase
MTNAAAAMRSDPAQLRTLQRIVAMGGAWRTAGNVTQVAEYNVWCDAEAARAVYDSGVPVTAVGLDVTKQVRVESAQFAGSCELVRRMCSHSGWSRYLHDPLALGVAIDPSFVRTERGLPVVDNNGRTRMGGPGQLEVAMEVDARRFLDLFLSRVASEE